MPSGAYSIRFLDPKSQIRIPRACHFSRSGAFVAAGRKLRSRAFPASGFSSNRSSLPKGCCDRMDADRKPTVWKSSSSTSSKGCKPLQRYFPCRFSGVLHERSAESSAVWNDDSKSSEKAAVRHMRFFVVFRRHVPCG